MGALPDRYDWVESRRNCGLTTLGNNPICARHWAHQRERQLRQGEQCVMTERLRLQVNERRHELLAVLGESSRGH